jgi:DNA processing protein
VQQTRCEDIISLWACPGVGPVTVAALAELARHLGISPCEAARLPTARLRKAGLPAAALGALRGAEPAKAGRRAVRAMERMGACPLWKDKPPYPARLTGALEQAAPPVLCIRGNPDLLTRPPAIAIVGSREPSPRARDACRGLSQGLSAAGHVLVSGGARGIDTIAHSAGLDRGAAVVVSPVGLEHFRWRGRRPRTGDSWCLVSQFPPSAGWQNEQALMRNRVIVALADAVVAFEPRDRGGTWHSCNQALEMGRPLFVVNAAEDASHARGHRSLVRRGAVALAADHMPSPEELGRMVAEYRAPARGDQTSLFEDR